MTSLEYRVLGPLEVVRGSERVALGPARQRAVLAMLVLRHGQVVSSDSIVEGIWGDDPPPSARAVVQVHVSNLRKMLAEAGRADALVTRAPGYALELTADTLDLDRFRQLASAARSAAAGSDAANASHLSRAALVLWRGEPLADLDEPFAAVERAALQELHIATLEERIEADLALGRHALLVPELERLTAVHPYRERLVALLMLALYRSNRQADALAAYRATRLRFSEELGIDPGTTLQELEIAILRQDPALELRRPDPTSSPIHADADDDSRSRAQAMSIRHRRRLAFFLGAAALVGVVTLLVSLRPSTDVRPAADTLTIVDGRSLQITGSIPVGGGPGRVGVSEDAVWVANEVDQTVVAVAVGTGRMTVRGLAAVPTALAVGSESVWIGLGNTGSFVRIAIDDEAVIGPYEAGEGATGRASLAAVDETLWIALRDGTLRRFGPGDPAPVVVAEGLGDAEVIAADDAAVWWVRDGEPIVYRVTPAGDTQSFTLRGELTAIVLHEGSAWVASQDSHIWQLSPASGTALSGVALPYPASALAVSETALWAVSAAGKAAFRVTWRDMAVDMLRFEHEPGGIAVVGEQVFIALR